MKSLRASLNFVKQFIVTTTVLLLTIDHSRAMTQSDLFGELQALTTGLLFRSEVEYPIAPIFFEGVSELSSEKLLELRAKPTDAFVEIITIDQLFSWAVQVQDWQEEDEKAEARRFQALVACLKTHFSDIAVYRVGRVELEVFVVGKTKSGLLGGVYTRQFKT